jgi:hypothetical protein
MERNLLMRNLLNTILFVFTLHLPVFGGEEVKQQVADAFGYPVGRLTLSDRSSEVAEKSKGNYFAVMDVKSGDNSFAPIELAISKRGVMLKPEREAYCEKAIAEGSTSIKKFALSDGGYGYSGIGMVGPGGSEERITATWPEMGIDLQVKIRYSREGLDSDDETKAYHQMVVRGGEALTGKMVDLANHLARYAQEQKLYIASGPGIENSSKPRPFASNEEADASPKQPTDTATIHENSPASRWPWIFGIAGVVAVLIFLFKRLGKSH